MRAGGTGRLAIAQTIAQPTGRRDYTFGEAPGSGCGQFVRQRLDGIAQGLGLALMEEFIPGRTENLHDYLIPTIGDIPPIETIIIEDPDEHGPYGAKGLGEHVLIPTTPAILNAIRDATGARITQTPATPTRVLAAIEALKNG